MSRDPRPRPGSDEALRYGCTCDIRDNNHGQRAPYPPNGWYVTGGCPVHDPDNGITDAGTAGIPVSDDV